VSVHNTRESEHYNNFSSRAQYLKFKTVKKASNYCIDRYCIIHYASIYAFPLYFELFNVDSPRCDSRVASRPSLVDTQNVWYRIDSEKDGIDASLFPT